MCLYCRDDWCLDGWGENTLCVLPTDSMCEAEVLNRAARELGETELDAALASGYGLFARPARHQGG